MLSLSLTGTAMRNERPATKDTLSLDTLSLDTTVIASSQQVSCDLADEVVVLSLSNGAYFGLDPIAARIWELLREPRTVAAIRDILLSEYDGVDTERCTTDLLDLLGELIRYDLVTIVDDRDR